MAFSTPSRPPALGVTLISSSNSVLSAEAARLMSGVTGNPESDLLDRPGATSDEFAVELAEQLCTQADEGGSGVTLIALDPEPDLMEVGLIVEHVFNQRDARQTRVGVLDLVAVTSVAEITRLLFRHEVPDVDEGFDGPMDAAERLAGRIEIANIIAIADLTPENAGEVSSLVLSLRPGAEVLPLSELASYPARRARLIPHRVHRSASSIGWQQALDETTVFAPEAPIDMFVFHEPFPFHPERLREAVEHRLTPGQVGQILRSRGLCQLATRPDQIGSWSIAGDIVALAPTTMRSWERDAPAGQEIVFFGIGLNHERLRETLTDCLLTPEELVAGPHAWALYEDAFPAWGNEHQH